METIKFKYVFAKDKNSKVTCPKCNEPQRYRRYINVETNKFLPNIYGKCDRVGSCKHFYDPYKNPPEKDTNEEYLKEICNNSALEKIDYTSFSIVKKSLKDKYKDNLSIYLFNTFPNKNRQILETLNLYEIGCSNYFDGNATVFWQKDTEGKYRGGKIMKYDLEKGKRDKGGKSKIPKITWVHTFFKKREKEYNLKQTFFGAHLIPLHKNKTICVVESEKTAILCNIFKPDFIWISCGQMYGLSEDKLEILKDRKTIFYPDKGTAYEIWNKKIQKANNILWKISDVLENNSEMKEGDDIADLILKKFGK